VEVQADAVTLGRNGKLGVDASASMRLEGFDGDNLVAADTLTLN
jgi:hypothetical protein